ncbi:MAG: GGDEF domain-containing protein [Chitinivibrionales bacterium]|nr:GGDEF domain-containing protein [Chitinivibrionales bacterium]
MPPQETDHFGLIIQKLTGKIFKNREGRKHWQMIIGHKTDMEAKLGRLVGIQTAAIDYIDLLGKARNNLTISEQPENGLDPIRNAKSQETWVNRIYAPGYYLEKMKEEMLRSKRYKHSLSAILLDVDKFHKINEDFSYQTGDEILTIIVKIIKNTIRTVDIVTRYSGDRFLLILPNTNRREAMELAERLRGNIYERTKRIAGLKDGVTATLCAGQYLSNDKSLEFMKQIENTLNAGKRNRQNAVYEME